MRNEAQQDYDYEVELSNTAMDAALDPGEWGAICDLMAEKLGIYFVHTVGKHWPVAKNIGLGLWSNLCHYNGTTIDLLNIKPDFVELGAKARQAFIEEFGWARLKVKEYE